MVPLPIMNITATKDTVIHITVRPTKVHKVRTNFLWLPRPFEMFVEVKKTFSYF